ncbi:tetratricopeptide repeat protein [Parasphingorhabdus sp.]|uniref:tetratricopeptide repeat protein n=1 Tax=Parasphingorhabdus sp. TaxID=2709688 RepID=UPI0039E52A99
MGESRAYDAFIEKAGNLVDSKKFDDAIEHLSSAEAGWKENKRVQAYLGYAYFYTDQFRKAILCFNKVLKDVERAENIRFMRGLSFDRLDDVASALSDYLQVLKLNPRAKSVHRNIGLLYESMGDHEKAKFYYKKALELDEDDPGLRQQLADLDI